MVSYLFFAVFVSWVWRKVCTYLAEPGEDRPLREVVPVPQVPKVEKAEEAMEVVGLRGPVSGPETPTAPRREPKQRRNAGQ